VLPLAHHQEALQGKLPLGPLLPDPHPVGDFRTEIDYYWNYLIKVKGGALFFRDVYPDGYAGIGWGTLALGVALLAAAGHQQPPRTN
jgi:hypothetical protein